MRLIVFDIETARNDRAQQYVEQIPDKDLFKNGDFPTLPANYKKDEAIKKWKEETLPAKLLAKRNEKLTRAALSWVTGQVVCISATIIETPMDTAVRFSDVNNMFGRYVSSRNSQTASLGTYAWALGMDAKHMDGAQVPLLVDEMRVEGGVDHWKDIVNYCEHDVEITAEMLSRYLTTEDSQPVIGEYESFFGLNENRVITQFYQFVRDNRVSPTELIRLVGKSSKDFDLPFLVGRSIYNGVPLLEELREF